MTSHNRDSSDSNEIYYVQSDIVHVLCISVGAILVSAVKRERLSAVVLETALALAKVQASLYGIPWNTVIDTLCNAPELQHLAPTLRRFAAAPEKRVA